MFLALWNVFVCANVLIVTVATSLGLCYNKYGLKIKLNSQHV